MSETVIRLTPKDFTTDQENRWCPGCGDYAILKSVRKALVEIGRNPDEVVFVSGIGCASRFPYYLETYGFHTIHGRAPSVATGVKLANPDLDVWVVGGDGDFLSIGGNHLTHTLRRNLDLNLLLINNAIYGLTKGQYSPTSSPGTRSPSSPEGSIDTPVNPAALALGAGGGFIARTADTLQQHLPQVLIRAQQYKGASFVEVLQDCIVYNADAFGDLTNKKTRAERTVLIEHGQPLLFGAEQDKALEYDAPSGTFSITDDLSAAALHDETNLSFAWALAHIDDPALPTPLGVLYCKPRPDYTSVLAERVAYQPMSRDDLKQILYAGSWEA
jgi:2-oxoglutarate ferredoxin oxidoreductase subunit beta